MNSGVLANTLLLKLTKQYKCIFIDLDDTLWDFHTNARLSLQLMFDQRNLNQHFESFDAFFAIYAKRNIELWEAYGKGEISKEFLMAERFRYPLSQMGLNDEALAEEIGNEYLDILPTQTTLMPHAREVLDYLSAKYPLSIISNGFVEVQHKKIKSSNLGSYFEHIILSEAAGALKPDPAIFHYALKQNNCKIENAIMIGDNYAADITGAKAAGIDQVYYPLPHHLKENQSATHIIHSLLELKQIL